MKDPFKDAGPDKVIVSRAWYDYVMSHYERLGCPFCNSQKEPIYEAGDEKFNPRYGCRDCDNWWGPKELRF